jgi:hypothetical protein
MSTLSFNSDNENVERALSTTIEIGWLHNVVENESGRTLVYKLDDAGNKIAKKYQVPVMLTVYQTFDRAKVVTADMVKQLALGDMSSLIEVLDAVIGNNIIESIGTDESVTTTEFLKFLNWLVDELKLTEILGSPGN